MKKPTNSGTGSDANKSTADTRNDLPSDPEILSGLLVALKHFIDQFRTEFDDNPLGACLALESLLRDLRGKRIEPQTVTPLSVKPEFFVAVKFLDLEALEDQLALLQSAVKAIDSGTLEEREPFSLSLNEEAEISHYRSSQQNAGNRIRNRNDSYAGLIDILVRARDGIAEALTESGPWSRFRSPDEWSTIFDRRWDTLRGYFERQEIRNKKLSSKLYRVHLDDLPATYQDESTTLRQVGLSRTNSD